MGPNSLILNCDCLFVSNISVFEFKGTVSGNLIDKLNLNHKITMLDSQWYHGNLYLVSNVEDIVVFFLG